MTNCAGYRVLSTVYSVLPGAHHSPLTKLPLTTHQLRVHHQRRGRSGDESSRLLEVGPDADLARGGVESFFDELHRGGQLGHFVLSWGLPNQDLTVARAGHKE